MNILVVGGSGLVGGNLYRELSSHKFVKKIIGTHFSYATHYTQYFDPLEPFSGEIASVSWDVIIHTGALTHVDRCETEIELSYKLTVESTLNLLKLAQRNNAKFVYISTDYVFDGRNGPYSENDAVFPLNVYGRHKLEAEDFVKTYNNHLIIRVTNVYGHEERNKNFVAAMISKLKTQDVIEIDVPTDQYATPINASDIAKAIVLLLQDSKTGIYHLASTDYMSRFQLISRINNFFEQRIQARGKTTQQLAQKALRPLQGGLLCAKFLSEYPNFVFTNIDDYLKQ